MKEKLAARLREEALGNSGRVALGVLLECLLPVAKLRDLAREHGLSPKGGFRLDKAPARVLVPLLTEPELPAVLAETCAALAERMLPDPVDVPAVEPGVPGTDPVNLQPVLRLKEQELVQVRAELEKARQVAEGLRSRISGLSRDLEQEGARSTRMQKEVDSARDDLARQGQPTPVFDRDLANRLQSLEKELEEQNQIELSQRLKIAEQAAAIRELDERVAELDALLPKGKKRRKRKDPPPPPERFVVPTFAPSFFKSLAGRDRRSVEHAYRAVFLFCTEGSRYPGLQVKPLDPSNVWSLRASLKLRVFFRWLSDGDVEILELLDRQEQDTALRRYREKP